MNSLDLIILCVIGFFAVRGGFKGIIVELFTLAALVLGYVAATREMSLVAAGLKRYLHVPDMLSNVLGFAIIFTIVVVLLRFAGLAMKKFAQWSFLGWVDRMGGILFGTFKGSLVVSLLLLLVSLLPLGETVTREQEVSKLFKPVRSVAPWVYDRVKVLVPGAKDFYAEVKEGFEDQSKQVIDNMVKDKIESIEKEVEKRVEGQ